MVIDKIRCTGNGGIQAHFVKNKYKNSQINNFHQTHLLNELYYETN